MNKKIARFLAEQQPQTPCLVVDLDVVAGNYKKLRHAVPDAKIYYAVKANPAPEILKSLSGLGSSFDTASVNEIDMVLATGAGAERISYGNTIKKKSDIAAAYARGVRLYAFDCAAELDKIAAAAPGSRVFCRILTSGAGADWPLSRKFGCDVDMARELLLEAAKRDVIPHGVSFHVGSQQRDLSQWDIAVGKTKMLFTALNEKGIELKLINLGGGFPAKYKSRVPAVDAYGQAIMGAMTKHFGNNLPQMIVEPGRGIAGDAGVIQAEVVLISTKTYDYNRRWVYLDIGKFGGLPETIGEAIQYRLKTPHDGGKKGPVVLAGPTCDEVDVLYDSANYQLPLDLQVGDKVQILATGAYTTTYSSVCFNGVPPLKSYYL
jgi:ornithine decarboxylase